MSLAEEVLRGDKRATGKLISLVENEPDAAVANLQELYPHTSNAHVVGITGPPGSGKSTITTGLAKRWRAQGRRVGIIAVDPNSPFSGGALLGDRVRMQELATDSGVFIRSMSARGKLGGLARATHNVVRVLDAGGHDLVLVETVGVGQSEVDIVQTADTVVVALMPGMGDYIQTIKAGIIEIADVFAVNKADRPDVSRLQMELETVLDWSHSDGTGWRPPVVMTVATTGEGIEELESAIGKHWTYLRDTGELSSRRRERYQAELQATVEEYWRQSFFEYWQREGHWDCVVDQLLRKESDPFTAARQLLRPFLESREETQGGG